MTQDYTLYYCKFVGQDGQWHNGRYTNHSNAVTEVLFKRSLGFEAHLFDENDKLVLVEGS